MNSKEKSLVYISLSELYSHPDNPRKDLGDLQELADSIKAKGVMQNLTVVPGHTLTHDEWSELSKQYNESPNEELRVLMNSRKSDKGYTVIIGHRRTEAARLAGLTELPCIITDLTPAEQIQTMLLENMQRSDLTVYEQAQGFQMMLDFGDTVESISEKTGFSATTVRRRLKMTELNQDILKTVSSERQLSLMDFDRISEIKDIKTRNKVLEQMGTNNFENALSAALSAQKLKANQKCWLEELSKYNATEIPEKDKWDSAKYTTLPYVSVTSDPVEKLKELFVGDGPFYYCMDKWGSIYLRKGKTQEETDKAAAQQMEREQKEEHNRQIRAALDDAFERAYGLRFDFIKGISETTAKKHITDIVQFLAVIGYNQYGSFDDEIYARLINIDISDDSEDKTEKALTEAVVKSPYYSLLMFAYTMSEDNKGENCYSWNNTYRPNHDLERIYRFLGILGYEMSDEESDLLTGKSNLYVKPEEPVNSTENSDNHEDETIEAELIEEDDFSNEDDASEDDTDYDEILEKLKAEYGGNSDAE